MKRSILSILLLSAFSIGAIAQITVTSTHIANLGDTVLLSEDTLNGSGLDMGQAAGDQVWDFTSLVEHDPDGAILEDPSTAPLYTNFPDADFVVNDLEEDSAHIFFKRTNTALDIVGFVEYDSNGNAYIPETNGEWRFMQFPATYGTTFNSLFFSEVQTSYLGIDFDSIGPHPFIDSLRNKFTVWTNSEIDAWGDVQLAQGTYTCIRQKVYQTVKASGDCYYNGSWHPYTPLMSMFIDSVYLDTADDVTYRWWSDNEAANFFVAEVNVDSNGTPDSSVVFAKNKPIWPQGISTVDGRGVSVYPNPAVGPVTISTELDGFVVNVYDIRARMVASRSFTSSTGELSVSDIPAGTYLLEIRSMEGALVKLQKLQIVD